MANVPFSVRLDEEVKAKLKREAELAGSSESSLVASAIKNYLDVKEHKRQAIDAAVEVADQGQFISSESMRNWVNSWGNEEEQDMPKVDIALDS